jgi:hypothetical protein
MITIQTISARRKPCVPTIKTPLPKRWPTKQTTKQALDISIMTARPQQIIGARLLIEIAEDCVPK